MYRGRDAHERARERGQEADKHVFLYKHLFARRVAEAHVFERYAAGEIGNALRGTRSDARASTQEFEYLGA